ncbi:Glycine oxidase [Aliiroseovarius sp. xm-m-379]|nr:Glycine oxidase [Aliiroseovarius sp. xm-d-517]NRP24170.1 Glycine oxidase [Aliiroseovarius sp. xm-m-379]NRP30017.1 Glycine oxidase [Aliiroseovarius sp. xm-m-314]NRP32969.1 Glycine oxidase [Aliiroseovarius sp. xm-a-104]NRP40028.1 Glycine oxidase [Aliiroseovarius sp. xm-m-339-2]NRP43270.1 Glycine oxidase [Aliiroseovarius sp. xm-m-378]NRP49585.1 Glycine oxidase [Aliiroseovarius sp. xm-m-354]NRP61034.1 Glycine oxidase [Aliiroseovarius sp. xm-a-151]NRP64141.1 Glycine oxidase [Aliiroseovarius s
MLTLATVDVTVMGAGVFGLSTAFACALRGAKVRVIERTGIGAGCSGGVVGMLAPHAPENWNDIKEFQFQSLIMAENFWQQATELSGLPTGYGRVGRLQPIDTERGLELARERAETARSCWQGKATWVVKDAPQDDWSPRSETGLVIHDTLSARIHPRSACDALAGAIRALGGEVVIGDAPTEGKLVWATGLAGLQALSAEREKQVGNGVKGQAALLGLDARGMAQIAAGPVLIVPHDNGTVAVGSTSERDYASADETDEQLDEILLKATEVLPVLRAAPIIERWAGLRPRARSRAPMLGQWPGREGEFIVNGGFKIGFGMAPNVANVMADLILDETDRVPERFRVEASL